MKRRIGEFIIVLILFYSCSGSAFSEERKSSFSSELSYVKTGGNTDTSTASLDTLFKRTWPSFILTFKGGLLSASQDRETSAESYYLNEKGDAKTGKKLYVYEFIGWRRDVFSGIDSRYSFQAGTGYDLIRDETQELVLEAGLDYTMEDRRPSGKDEFSSLRTFGRYQYALSKTSMANQEMELLFNLEDSRDFRMNTATSVEAMISALLSMKVSYIIRFDNQPVPGFADTDNIFSASLLLKV